MRKIPIAIQVYSLRKEAESIRWPNNKLSRFIEILLTLDMHGQCKSKNEGDFLHWRACHVICKCNSMFVGKLYEEKRYHGDGRT